MLAVVAAATESEMPKMPKIPGWLVGIGAAVLAIVLLAAILLLATWLLNQLGAETWLSLPVLAILGMLLLLTTLAAVSVAFGHFGLSDKSQALALPEGSIRAVIALSLVIIFAILTVFLYGTLASGTQQPRITEVANFDRAEILRHCCPVNKRTNPIG
jgi:amino acid transporter